MKTFRKASFILVAVVVITAYFGSDSFAWEFSMDGQFNYIYERYDQMGANGFFGKYNVDRSTGSALIPAGDYRNLNGWFGFQVNDFVSGSNAGRHYQTLELYPSFRINKAILFRGKYRLGKYGDPYASDYITNTMPGVDVATSDGQWTQWWVMAQTPLGQLVVGKRPEAFGVGLQYNGAVNNTTEGVALVAPYGPFRISFAVRPFWPQPPNGQIGARKVGDNPNFRLPPGSPYYNLFDMSGIMNYTVRYFTTYQAGPIDAGVFLAWQGWHAGPEARSAAYTSSNDAGNQVQPGPEGFNNFNAYDLSLYHGTIYFKYNNGRFFFNTEWAYWYENSRLSRSVSDIGSPGMAPNKLNGKGLDYSVASWRRMIEFGVMAGPSRLSLLYAYLPGPDRRNGYVYNDQSYNQGPGQGNYTIFRPYSYLLGYVYGSGVNAFDTGRYGYFNAAEVLAGRIDYALAANLNIFGSFLWSQRSTHGYSWGYLRPAKDPKVTPAVNATASGISNVIKWIPYVGYQNNDGAPNIPDRELGWEVTGGFEWELLDRYRLRTTVAYWKPGKWFSYACVDRGVEAWNRETRTNYNSNPYYPFGVNPDREIDAIMGGEVALTVEF